MAEVYGNRTNAEIAGKVEIPNQSGAECGADDAESGAADADLEPLIAAWPTLPEAVKADILAMAKAANS